MVSKDQRPGNDVDVRPASAHDLGRVITFLEDAEVSAGTPLVDEAERRRLDAALGGPGQHPQRPSRRFVAERGAEVLGYASVTDGVGDLAVGHGPDRRDVITQLASAIISIDDPAHPPVQVWMRGIDAQDVAQVSACGFVVRRRLGVLGRSVTEPRTAADVPAGFSIRGYLPDEDDPAVVEVLVAAYDGTDDGGWELEEFSDRRRLPWFRSQDLLLGVDDEGSVSGLHWLKRRGDDTGEVYNLAVHPRAQGTGLGQALLEAGLRHLADVGCSEVILWVDLANERAVRLYRGMGFTVRWEDVAFGAVR